MKSVTSAGELLLGRFCIGVQFNFHCRDRYGCVINLLPVLAINWNNSKCIFGVEIGWLNFNGCPYLREAPKGREKKSLFWWTNSATEF